MNLQTVTPDTAAGSPVAGRRSRRAVVLTCVAGAALAGTVAAAAPASADFSPYVPVTTGYAGDCTAKVGAYYTYSGGPAVGNSTLSCTARHAYTNATVSLYRWVGSGPWQVVSSNATSFTNSFGMGTRELRTGQVCGPGAYWFTRLDFNVSGVGSFYTQPKTSSWYDPCGTAA